ncbi:MAG: hypothetical protein V7K64_32400 [Nostoc sp.]|uniref:hypothetical protein n=1 Tax=unclassified Nostoc TaxID=2593658 RepID=UPI001DDF57D2|nr:hypothetical protein [Nostoc sp. JL34]MBN3882539.1 hypothetical protein [Nostoc sp. JL34]
MAYPFRINTSKVSGDALTSDTVSAEYSERLLKLIPSEVLSLYVAVRGLWIDPLKLNSSPAEGASLSFLDFWPIICIVLLILFRLWGTRLTTDWKTTQLKAVAISAISFVIWVYTLGDDILGWHLPDTRYAATAAIVWVFAIPIFFPYLVTDTSKS